MKKALVAALILAPLLAAVMVGTHVSFLLTSSQVSKEKVFTINAGEGFSRVNYRLYQEGIIDNMRIFHYLAKFKGQMTSFQAGRFKIKKDSSMLDVLEQLTEGQPILDSFTIPEGKNIFQIADILENQGLTTKKEFLALAKDETFTRSLGIPASRVEGYLFPETYTLAASSSAETIIKLMVTEFNKRSKDLLNQHPTLTAHEVVTLASVVEKETGAAHERPLIASVFSNRLKKRMRLQSDPTTIYGIYENFNGNLRKKHLLEKTPYNTYKIPGLPRGPICSPSLEAIKAVLTPQKSDYLYFVSKNDGTHEFTTNYKDHLKAVEFYQKTAANRRGKSWRQLKNKNH